jgi:release factor glutamine methyltransferase
VVYLKLESHIMKMPKESQRLTPVGSGQTHITVPEKLYHEVISPTDWAHFLIEKGFDPSNSEKHGKVLDLGTGSGILAIELAKRGCEHVFAGDVSKIAVETALANVKANSMQDRVTIYHGDMYGNLPLQKGDLDLIVANPPTLPINKSLLKHNGIDLAFFTESDGRYFIDAAIIGASEFLKPGGCLIILHPSYHDMAVTRRKVIESGLHLNIRRAEKPIGFQPFAEVMSKYGYDVSAIINMLSLLSNSGKEAFFKPSDNGSIRYYYLDVLKIVKPTPQKFDAS